MCRVSSPASTMPDHSQWKKKSADAERQPKKSMLPAHREDMDQETVWLGIGKDGNSPDAL